MDPQLKKVLNNQISVSKVTTFNKTGDITYKDPTVVSCYISGEVKMVRNLAGVEVVSTLSIFISGTDATSLNLQHNDKVTLPNGRTPPIIAINNYYDDKGMLYSIEVNL
jgi:hypothetical protein